MAAVAATTTLLATVGLPSGVASAATTDDCVRERSVRLYTQGANDEDRIWVDTAGPRVVVCFRLGSQFSGGLTIVVDHGTSVTLPDVRTGANPLACPQVVRDIADPVRVRLALNLATNTVCVTLGDTTTTVTFVEPNVGGALPELEIWHDGGPNWGWLDAAACPVEYLLAITVPGSPTDCMEANARIV